MASSSVINKIKYELFTGFVWGLLRYVSVCGPNERVDREAEGEMEGDREGKEDGDAVGDIGNAVEGERNREEDRNGDGEGDGEGDKEPEKGVQEVDKLVYLCISILHRDVGCSVMHLMNVRSPVLQFPVPYLANPR